jgi:hypothetical protein
VLLIFFSGCFYNTTRDYSEYVDDLNNRVETPALPTADTAEPPATPPLPKPPTELEACSTTDGELVDVVFSNQLGFHVDLYYVYPDCSTQNVVLLQAGDTYDRTTHIGGVWRARDPFGGRGWVHELRVEAGQTELVLP